MTYRLGRVVNQDARSLNFPARAAAEPRTVTWRRYGLALDQGETNACTGHAIAHGINHAPIHATGARTLTHDDAMRLYSSATQIDPFAWTFPPSDNGSSVLAACKAAKNAGLIASYSWAFGLDHALRALALGPVMLGTAWLESMFTPDASGRIVASGASAGGHAYLAVGCDVKARSVTIQNSWGPGWGVRGRARIGWDDLGRLLADHGDAVSISRA